MEKRSWPTPGPGFPPVKDIAELQLERVPRSHQRLSGLGQLRPLGRSGLETRKDLGFELDTPAGDILLHLSIPKFPKSNAQDRNGNGGQEGQVEEVYDGFGHCR